MPLVFLHIRKKFLNILQKKIRNTDCRNEFSGAIEDDTGNEFSEHLKNQIQENISVHINKNIRKNEIKKKMKYREVQTYELLQYRI